MLTLIQDGTQSARSRRSYGKIGDCEQSTLRWTKLTSVRHPQLSSFCFFPLAIIKCKNSLLFDLIPKAVVLVIYTCWTRWASHSPTWFKHGGKTWRKTQKSSCRILDIPCAPVEIKVSKNEIIKQKTDPYSLGETHDFNSFPSKGYLFWFPLTFTLTCSQWKKWSRQRRNKCSVKLHSVATLTSALQLIYFFLINFLNKSALYLDRSFLYLYLVIWHFDFC